MCGIAGVLGSRPLAELEENVRRMVSALHHRGPDGDGLATVATRTAGSSLALGHARLSILDLSDCASQPMVHAPTGNWLVYNGEMYNFRTLRADLESHGHKFRSTGDTEVVLTALSVWGAAALERFEGMYAFAFWNEADQQLLLGRDPLGIKPMLVAKRDDAILFASELKAFRAGGCGAWSLDHSAIDSFLFYGCVLEPRTIYRDVRMLPPGTVMTVTPDLAMSAPRPIRSLIDFMGASPSRSVSFRETLETSRQMLADAVDSQLVSDVPIGVCLSGGIDSTLIATSAAASKSRPDLRFLTVDSGARGFTERAYAEQVSRKLGRPHHVMQLSAESLLELLPRAVAAMDQPTVDGVNTYVISAVAAQLGIKVLLSGLGGDEVFGGYTTFRKVPMLLRHRGWMAPGSRLAVRMRRKWSTQLHKVAQSEQLGSLFESYLLQRSIRWRGASSYLSGLPWGPPDAPAIPAELHAELEHVDMGDDFRRIAYFETAFYMRNQLLRDADIFSSANSVEMRVPFLDTRLIRHAWSLPADYHLGFRGKRLLRALAHEEHGSTITRRRKMGFVLPWDMWLRGPLFEEVSDTLLSRSVYADIGVDVSQSSKMLKAFKAHDPLVSWSHVWSLFSLARTIASATA